ncbi:MAG: hypothetical protein ACM3YF_06315 [Candidatus Zixiibacteriota bacterium]
MKNVGFWIPALALFGVFVLLSSVSAQDDTTFFRCFTTDSVQPPAAPAGQRTLAPVALFACGSYANKQTLPKWYDSVWTLTIPHSVPKYFKDNSLGRYIMYSDAFGRTIKKSPTGNLLA